MMSDDDNDGQMIFGDLGGLKLPDICLTGEEKHRKKTSPRKPVPTGDRTRARCMTGGHAAAWPTAVDLKIWDFNHYVQKRVHFLKEYSHSLKLQYLFRAHVIFQFTH